MNLAWTFAVLLGLSFTFSTSSGRAQVTPVDTPEQKTVRVDVDLVLISATVTDSENRYVTGLQREHFQVWEDKVEQTIDYFVSEDLPLSAGIVFDVSGSMASSMPVAREAVATFLRMGNPQDEYFLVEFSDTPRLASDFTSDIADLQHKIAFSTATGRTALYDALYLAMDRVSRGVNPRKALIVITDGQDNRSRYSYSNLKEFAKEKDIQIYAIGITDWSYSSRVRATAVLGDLARTTGGRAFFPDSNRELESICQKIGLELKNQYLLGYRSTNTAKDGLWRKVKVKTVDSKDIPRLTVRAKTGYYASATERVSK